MSKRGIVLLAGLIPCLVALWIFLNLSHRIDVVQQSKTGASVAGAKGEQGNAGLRGLQGLQGLQGATGTDGANGTHGTAGVKGLQGATGQAGPATAATCTNGSCVSLQTASPAVQETGNISLSGTATANTVTANRVYQRPYKLLIYYGIPQGVNNAFEDNYAAQLFSRWDYVVFGTGLEDPANTYHSSTQTIISKMHALNAQEKVFGYIDLGVTTGNLSITTMKTQVDQWKATGADDIFLDTAGYDFHVSRDRLNTMLDYIHSQGLNAMVNAFTPDDVMGSAVNATYNPSGTPTHMNSSDYYLLESWVVNTAAYTSHNGFASTSDIKTRGDSAISYRTSLGVKIVSIGAVDYSSYNDTQIAKYFEMNQAAASVFSLDGYGISAVNYSSIAPNVDVVRSFDFDPNYSAYYNASAPYTINGPWTEITRPDANVTFHDDTSTNTFWYTSSPVQNLQLVTTAPSTVALTVQGAPGQTANLLNVVNDVGTVLLSVDASGNFALNGATLTLSSNVRAIAASITTTATTLAITFGTAYPDANYAVLCTPSYNTTCFVTNRTGSGFTLNFGTAAPAGATVSWLATR